MRENAGVILPATEKQKEYARRLGIGFGEGIGKRDMSALIGARAPWEASAKQKAFARRLGIAFDAEIKKSDIGKLIDAALAEKRARRRNPRPQN